MFLILVLLVTLNALGGINRADAEGNAAVEDAAVNVVTLEQAVELTVKNSRTMTRYEINKEKARYQLYQAQDRYNETNYESNSLWYKYDSLSNEYSALEKELNETEGDTSEILVRMNEIQEEIRQIEDEMDRQSEQMDSTVDQKKDAEDKYDDTVAAEDNYEKQLVYIVAQVYTTILNQAGNLQALYIEQELKQSRLEIENKKLQLGRTSQAAVDSLAMEVRQLDRESIELGKLINTQKGNLNDMMGREYEDELTLAHFEVQESIELPNIDALKSKTARDYDALAALQRDLDKKKDDLDSVSESDYEHDILELEIKEMKLQLAEERLALNERVNNLITDVQARQEDYQVSQINYAYAQQSYEWDEIRYRMGRLSRLDLLQSVLNCQNAKDKSVSAGYSFYLLCRALELAEDGIMVN
ncbi:MAG: hypothetical protein VR67_05385 [Peptococcaceae bacterium BRH_c8a]|nr:MAG: hypothetical protein VR67_05385 [Peptococcaceae bacterium BRH_c8a]